MSQTAISSYCIIFICYWNGTERFNDGDGILGPKSAVPNLWDGFSPYWQEVMEVWLEVPEAWLDVPIIWFRAHRTWLENTEAWLEAMEATEGG